MAQLMPYDDRDGFIWLDGKLVPWRDAKVHVLSHGLHYSSAAFEGERAYNGKIFKLTEHSERLINSSKALDMELPWTVAQIDQACNDTLAANKLKDAYVRPVIWRGSELMGVTAQYKDDKGKFHQHPTHMAVAVWGDWGSYFPIEERMKGIRVARATYVRPDPRTIPAKAKVTGLYMICTIEKQRAERMGYNDALMLDWRGHVAECTGANIFFVKDGALHTPTPDCFLDGITRRTIIQIARDRQMPVHERTILPDELGTFTEAFLVGTAAEVTPIAEIGEHRYKPGKICETILRTYAALVRGENTRAAAE